MAGMPGTVWTVGHSTRPLDAFLGLLAAHGIERVADVRRHPGSRAYPHFDAGALAASLGAAGIDYQPFPELGGRRTPSPGSRNTAWRNASFRAYADHMETPEFRAGLARLADAAAERRPAVLCAEAVWWRCHRGLIADALKASGVEVVHLVDDGKAAVHPYTSAARIVDGRLSYRADDA